MATDLWLEAREKTRKASQPKLSEKVAVAWQSLRGRPTRPVYGMMPFLRTNRAVVIDLSSYEPNFDVKSAWEEGGVRDYILRMAYPAVYQRDAWQLTEDTSYRRYFEKIRQYVPDATIGGYVIYVSGIDDSNYAASKNLANFVGSVMGGGHRPNFLIADDEVNYWWEGSRKVYATASNQVTGVSTLVNDFWKMFKLPGWHYSARWFVDQLGYKTYYDTWLTNINKGLQHGQKMIGNWWAWWPQKFTAVYSDPYLAVDELTIPTSTQVGNFLNIGDGGEADLWQFTASFLSLWNKNAAGAYSGVDASVTYVSRDAYYQQINFVPSGTTPPPDNPPPSPSGTYVDLATYLSHTHTISNVETSAPIVGFLGGNR